MVASIEKANEIIEQLQSHNQELTKQLESSHRKLSMLQHQIDQLLRRVYGRRSEKMDPNQLIFDGMLETLEQPELPVKQIDLPIPKKKKTPKKKRAHPGRIPIPEHLERVEIILDIPEQDKICPETG